VQEEPVPARLSPDFSNKLLKYMYFSSLLEKSGDKRAGTGSSYTFYLKKGQLDYNRLFRENERCAMDHSIMLV